MIVADASLLVSLLVDGGSAGHTARKVFFDAGGVSVPDLACVETVSVIRKRWLRGTIDVARCQEALEDLVDLPLSVYPTLPLMARAFQLRANVTTYDPCYVALAEALRCDLVTGDHRLAQTIGPKCQIRTINEFM